MPEVSRPELVERARKLAPQIAERALECERLRRLPDETIADFRSAGLLRAFVPPEYGGFGLEVATVIDTAREIGRACGNSAWCLAICTLHNHIVSGFPDAAIEHVFGSGPGPDSVVCGVFMPGGRGVRCDGGYRLSGAWDFASTCDHADFTVLSAFLCDAPDADPKGMGSLLLPRADFEIEDNWHVSGLCGTGSKRILVDDVFVREDHVLHTEIGFAVVGDRETTARGRLSAGLPGSSIATLGLTGVSIGIALGALEHFRERLVGKVRVATPKAVHEQVGAQLRYAESAAEVDAAELVVQRDLAEMTADAQAGRKATIEQRARYRRDAAWIVQTCTRAVARIQPAAGGHAIFLDNPIQRALRDSQAMAAHVVADWEGAGEAFARAQIGLPKTDPLV
ncbi:MAG: acyl-CoA dehydrogenase family protein [Deltaproteobacteria bacterium]|nr:acyl-CoA dehydrogenase family protein [Deltaproteobacteria bacterium]